MTATKYLLTLLFALVLWCQESAAQITIEGGGTNYYYDKDRDGFGDPRSNPINFPYTGYVSNNLDCNDNDATINPNTVWYQDSDGDGYGSPSRTLKQCTQPTGYVANNQDCNDSDHTINPKTKWYADTDNDGLGDPNSYVVQCNPINGYVNNANDACPEISSSTNNCSLSLYEPIAPTASKNYILSKIPQKPMAQINAASVSSNADLLEQIHYFDDLGRPEQQIAIKQSPSGHDIVKPIEYDASSRKLKDYMAYPDQGTKGYFRASGTIDKVKAYYLATYPNDFLGSTVNQVNPYSEKLVDNSPMNRVLKQAAPGTAWKLGNGHEIEFAYDSNGSGEVRWFDVVFTNNDPSKPQLQLNPAMHYAKNTLRKTTTKDENHPGTNTKLFTTEEFTDKTGNVLLKRNYVKNSSSGSVEPLDTYYVYDDYGNLTFVLPPKVDPTDGISSVELNELCYQYRYDAQNRLVEKKIPGKDWEYIIYNNLDRPILTQDALLRAKKQWLFTKYDALGRVVYTGIYTHGYAVDRNTMQQLSNGYTNMVEQKLSAPLMVDNYSLYYSNNSFPKNNLKLHTVNFYDNYDHFDKASLQLPTNVFEIPVLNRPQGLPTANHVRVLDTNSWNVSLTGYDQEGRIIYTAGNNRFQGSVDTSKLSLDFLGKPLISQTSHKKGNDPVIDITERFQYDPTGRLLTHTHQINGGHEELLVANSYDELGTLQSKKVGNTLEKPLQTQDFHYNVRGWLTKMNDVNDLKDDLFAYNLSYNTGAQPLFNGNISAHKWRSTNVDNNVHGYDYSYDALNRLTDAQSTEPLKYSVRDIRYDKMGNILGMTRYGHTNTDATQFGIMDQLIYSYDQGNKLLKVADNGNKDFGFKDGANLSQEYQYDLNGNMIKDANKNILDIQYNHLNLPASASIKEGEINYFYNAAGIKLRKIIVDKTSNTTDYNGIFIYSNNVLEYIINSFGYVDMQDIKSPNYVFQMPDYLGNIRITYNKQTNGNRASILKEDNYYPFGLKHKGYNNVVSSNANSVASKFKFQGVENEDLPGWEFLEMEFRHYDSALGRFISKDPVTHYDVSPYISYDNNPIFWSDPTGADSESLIMAAFNKSGSGRTDWTNNNDGNFSTEDGQTVECTDCKLIGGPLENKTYNELKKTYRTEIYNNAEFIDYMDDGIASLENIEFYLNTLGEGLGGVSGIRLDYEGIGFIKWEYIQKVWKKSSKKARKYIWKKLKQLSEKLMVKNPIKFHFMMAGTFLMIEGAKYGAMSEDLRKVKDNYEQMHKANPCNQSGVFKIVYFGLYPSSYSGSKVQIRAHYYDISTGQYLGSYSNRN